MWRDGIPGWETQGFAGPPAEFTSTGAERIMRCYSRSFRDRADNWHGSRQYGNCFWTFGYGDRTGPILNHPLDLDVLTATFLEANLNAALWNNTFQKIGVFQ